MRADNFITSLMYDSINEPTGTKSIDLSDRSTFRVVHRHLLMLPLRGQFIRVATVWSDKERRYISQYHWMWLKTMGLNHEWIVGDPVGEPAWERKDSNTAMADGDCPVAHMDAVQALMKLVDKNPDLIPAATYMKRPISNLFKASTMTNSTKDDPIVQANRKRFDEMRAKKQPDPYFDPLKDLPPMNRVTPTLDDIKAIIDGLNIKSDNYALGA
jgi:hypothetical protein